VKVYQFLIEKESGRFEILHGSSELGELLQGLHNGVAWIHVARDTNMKPAMLNIGLNEYYLMKSAVYVIPR